jgi:hypothetical protein
MLVGCGFNPSCVLCGTRQRVKGVQQAHARLYYVVYSGADDQLV